jgi:thiol-disulfide isomerase/thioredoxin
MSDYRGKFVLLSFWASWCVSCEPSIQRVKQLRDEFVKDSRLVVLGMNLDDSPEAAKEWIDKYQMTWPQGMLGEWSRTSIPEKYGISSLPGVVLIGPDGNVIASDLSGARIRTAVAEALSPPKQ